MTETSRWTWHILTGVIILVLLGLHMITMHLDSILGWFNPVEGEAATAWVNVAERAQSTGYIFVYVLLLGAALYHGLYGFRTILFELGVGKGTERFISVLFVLVGVGLFALGTWAAIAAHGNIPEGA